MKLKRPINYLPEKELIAIEENQMFRIKQTRTHILLNHPFYNGLIFYLDDVLSYQLPTAGTDGKNIYYNPLFLKTLSGPELKFLIYHELFHCILHTFSRRSSNYRL